MKYIDNRLKAKIVKLEDANNNYTSENVEGALEEINSQIKNIEANGYDDTQVRQHINNIKTEIGTEELTTNSKNIKGSVNELNSQIKDIEKYDTGNPRHVKYKNNGDNRPIISFIDDDGKKEVYSRLLPIMKAKNIKFGAAIITSFIGTNTAYMTLEQLKECKSNMETLSHMVDVATNILDSYTPEQQRYQLKESQAWLNSNGFKCKGLVYPQNTSDKDVRRIASEYYDFQTGILGFNESNFINTEQIKRIAFGSWEDGNPELNGLDKTSLAYAKACVDKCLNEKSWLIFMTHIANQPISKDSELGELIDYIKLKNIEILAPTEAIKVKGNIFNLGSKDDEYIIYDKGKFESNVINYLNLSDNSSLLSNANQLKAGKTYVCGASFGQLDYPDDGTLICHIGEKNIDNSYRMLISKNHYDRIYISRCDSNGTWKPFKLNGAINFATANSITNDTLPSAIPLGITHCQISDNTLGFPGNGKGLLICNNNIYNINGAIPQGWQTRIFQELESNNIYVSCSKWGDLWTEWGNINPKFKKITLSMPKTTITANSYTDVKITYSGLKPTTSVISGSPSWGIDVPMLLYNVFIAEADTITIRLFNLNSNDKTLTTRNWNFIVEI